MRLRFSVEASGMDGAGESMAVGENDESEGAKSNGKMMLELCSNQ